MTARSGRPLRALAGGMAIAALWFGSRVPGLEERYAAGMQALQVPLATASAVVMRAVEVVLAVARLPVAGDAAPTLAIINVPPKIYPPNRRESPLRQRTDDIPVSKLPPGQAATITAAPAVVAETPAANPGFALATQAYARLAAGARRDADRLFGEAIAAGPDPNRDAWVRERRRLNRHWSGDAYTLFRDASLAQSAAASPVLGGGQSGGSIAWAIDPLASRPLAIIGRIYAAHDERTRIDGDTAQAAIGLRWQPIASVSVAAERLIAVGKFTSSDWNLRVAAGGERRLGRIVLDGYGEAGVRGNGSVYAGGQARAAVPLGTAARMAISAGPGAWGSIQSAATTVSRVDLGVGVTGRLPAGIAINADWRWRVAGNAAPVSGPAVTVSAAF